MFHFYCLEPSSILGRHRNGVDSEGKEDGQKPRVVEEG